MLLSRNLISSLLVTFVSFGRGQYIQKAKGEKRGKVPEIEIVWGDGEWLSSSQKSLDVSLVPRVNKELSKEEKLKNSTYYVFSMEPNNLAILMVPPLNTASESRPAGSRNGVQLSVLTNLPRKNPEKVIILTPIPIPQLVSQPKKPRTQHPTTKIPHLDLSEYMDAGVSFSLEPENTFERLRFTTPLGGAKFGPQCKNKLKNSFKGSVDKSFKIRSTSKPWSLADDKRFGPSQQRSNSQEYSKNRINTLLPIKKEEEEEIFNWLRGVVTLESPEWKLYQNNSKFEGSETTQFDRGSQLLESTHQYDCNSTNSGNFRTLSSLSPNSERKGVSEKKFIMVVKQDEDDNGQQLSTDTNVDETLPWLTKNEKHQTNTEYVWTFSPILHNELMTIFLNGNSSTSSYETAIAGSKVSL